MTILRGEQALDRLLQYDDIKTVLDIGSGTGAHATALRNAGRQVTTISLQPPADVIGDFLRWENDRLFDAVWACHVLEHQADPGAFLRKCLDELRPGGVLAVTVPPLKHQIVGGHASLWNAGLLLYQLILAGFDCSDARVGTYGYNISVIVRKPIEPIRLPLLTQDCGDIFQLSPYFPAPLKEGFDGRLGNIRWTSPEEGLEIAPEHVAILGLGPSVDQYLDAAKRLGGRWKLADETWCINALGDVLACDRVFHMDDVRIQEIRAAAAPESNIAAMLAWMRHHPGPIYTSRAHPDYPGLVEFPLEAVLNHLGYGYFNSTAAYAIAYAIHLGVRKISLFGFDFTYPDAHKAEKGRGCVEFWLGQAAARGIQIEIPLTSTLMDGIELKDGRRHLYGYDTIEPDIRQRADGSLTVSFQEVEALPTAEEIEDRYDHARHPNALVE